MMMLTCLICLMVMDVIFGWLIMMLLLLLLLWMMRSITQLWLRVLVFISLVILMLGVLVIIVFGNNTSSDRFSLFFILFQGMNRLVMFQFFFVIMLCTSNRIWMNGLLALVVYWLVVNWFLTLNIIIYFFILMYRLRFFIIIRIVLLFRWVNWFLWFDIFIYLWVVWLFLLIFLLIVLAIWLLFFLLFVIWMDKFMFSLTAFFSLSWIQDLSNMVLWIRSLNFVLLIFVVILVKRDLTFLFWALIMNWFVMNWLLFLYLVIVTSGYLILNVILLLVSSRFKALVWFMMWR